MAFVIDTLTEPGMTVSDAKTVTVDGLRGPRKRRLVKPLFVKHATEGTCLRIACKSGFVDLPFRKQHPYPGIVPSYTLPPPSDCNFRPPAFSLPYDTASPHHVTTWPRSFATGRGKADSLDPQLDHP